MKKVIGALILGVMFVFGIAGTGFALTYQDGSDIQFTFNSTLSISLSDTDLIIGNLIPGQDDTSNAVDVIVNTNNLYGYTLTATVGDATKDYRDLRHTNGAANFASIDVNSDLSTLSGQSSSVWGYTISTDGTTWSNFNGLPKYDDASNAAELRATDGAAADSITFFKIGAYAAEGQLAGDYTNVINFKVVSNIAKTYIQDITAATCPTAPTTVYDSRDDEEYTIQQLADGNCWLLDNLRLNLSTTRSLSAADTNIVSNWTAPIGVDTWSGTFTEPKINTDSMNATGTGGYAAGKYGVYYNYCAATAGTYCYDSNSGTGDATGDICPKGWHMPSAGEDGEYDELYKAYDSVYSDYVNALHAPLSGFYRDGSARDQGKYGYFWSSSYNNEYNMYTLYIRDSNSSVRFASPSRNYAHPVRCILK